MKAETKQTLRLCAAIFCVILFGVLLGLVVTENAAGFDDPIRQFFYALRADGLTAVLVVITNMADKYFIIALCLLLLIIPKTRLPFGVPLSAGALATVILNSAIKHLVCRPRPDEVLHLVEEGGFSFPSGHSISSMFFYGMAIWLVWHCFERTLVASDGAAADGEPVVAADSAEANSLEPANASADGAPLRYSKRTAIVLTVLLLIPMITIGLTRIYLGVHYPTDVLAGWCLGGFAIFVEATILLALEKRRSADQNSTLPGSRSK